MNNGPVVERGSFFGLLADEGILPFRRTLHPRDRPFTHVVRVRIQNLRFTIASNT